MTSDSHKEIVWFDIPVNEGLAMNVLDTADHLIGQHKDCFDGETSRTEVEEILERWTQQVHDEDVVFLFLSIVSKNKSVLSSQYSGILS